MTTLDLPTYVSISEALERYHLGRETLTRLIENGRVRAVEVDGGIAVAGEDLEDIVDTLRAIQIDESLVGEPIRATEAAEKYKVSERTIGRWAEAGYIQVVDRGPKLLLLDEADVKLATEIFKEARQRTGSSVRAGWILTRTMQKFRPQ